MEKKIIDYIDRELSYTNLKIFLISLISSKKINDKLLCLCILIDLKYRLLEENDYSPLFARGNPNCSDDYEVGMPLLEGRLCLSNRKYARLVTKAKFELKFGTTKYENPSKGQELEIDFAKIRQDGWAGNKTSKDFIWVTLFKEMDTIIRNSANETYPANEPCDFVGLARDYSYKINPRKSSSNTIETTEFVLIIYPEEFPDCVYQPNSTSANWSYKNTLFICYENSDQFGRTFNENGVQYKKEYGKERVHVNSFYVNNDFKAIYVGKASHENLERKLILSEAYTRLRI